MSPIPDTLSDEAFALQIMQGAKTIQPNADFAADLEQRLTVAAYAPKAKRRVPRSLRFIGSAAAVLIMVAVGVFYVPPLRAIAEEIIGFFTRASSDQRSFTLDIYNSSEVQVFKSLQDAESALSHDFVEPQTLPSMRTSEEEIQVQVALITLHQQALRIEYQPIFALLNSNGEIKGYRATSSYDLFMWFSQVPKEDYYAAGDDDSGLVGKSAKIETISFTFKGHPVSGQFLRGIWQGGVVSQDELDAVKDGKDVVHEAVWVDDGAMQLIWEDENTVYTLQVFKQDILDLTREDMIQIAESIE